MSWFPAIASNIVLAALTALAAWIVQRRLGRPGLARILWVLALVKLVTPPLVRVPVMELPDSMACALGACHCAQHTGFTGLVRNAAPLVLLVVWAIGAMATMAIAWRRWVQFSRLTAHAKPAPRVWRRAAARLSRELSLRRAPEVLAVPGRLPPLVLAGWRGPRLLVPAELIPRLTHPQREALLLHELTHIRRGDHLMRLAELAVRAAFWWLPGLAWIGRQLRACEEACCDSAVAARRPRKRRDYATLLLETIDFAHPLPQQMAPQATALSAGAELEQRVRTILGDELPRRRTWPTALCAIGIAGAVMPLGLHYEFAHIGEDAAAAAVDNGDPAVSVLTQDIQVFCCPR